MDTVRRILLIDDDAVDRAAVRRALGKSGLSHALTEAVDGRSGLALARAQPFDCVLLDYRLPDVDTFALLAELLSEEAGKQAVLMLTGQADGDLALRLMRAGALDYLAKGEMTPPSLARAIRYAAARRAFVGELEVARREAEAKSLELDTLNRQKALLFSIIAHDLRNPFQALLTLSTVLSRAVADRDHASVERRAQGIRDAATQAHTLMESLFAWANVQMDTLAVTLTSVALEDVMGETIRGASQAAADKGIVLRASAADGLVRANRDMLATVLRNLVSNAVKFTMPGGSVTLSTARVGDEVEISVADSGIGIAPAKLDEMFKLERRTTTNGTAGERGSGLGLLLCRDLLERQGSGLGMRSVLGQGTVCSFRLPGALPLDPAKGAPLESIT